jgi:hypothetical protein
MSDTKRNYSLSFNTSYAAKEKIDITYLIFFY